VPNPNENCLKGMRCPTCGSYGPFQFACTVPGLPGAKFFGEVSDDGVSGGIEWDWDDKSFIRCKACGADATVDDFQDPEAPERIWQVRVRNYIEFDNVVEVAALTRAEAEEIAKESEWQDFWSNMNVTKKEIESVFEIKESEERSEYAD